MDTRQLITLFHLCQWLKVLLVRARPIVTAHTCCFLWQARFLQINSEGFYYQQHLNPWLMISILEIEKDAFLTTHLFPVITKKCACAISRMSRTNQTATWPNVWLGKWDLKIRNGILALGLGVKKSLVGTGLALSEVIRYYFCSRFFTSRLQCTALAGFAPGGGGGDSHMEQTGMLVGNLNLSPKGDHLGVAQAFCDP